MDHPVLTIEIPFLDLLRLRGQAVGTGLGEQALAGGAVPGGQHNLGHPRAEPGRPRPQLGLRHRGHHGRWHRGRGRVPGRAGEQVRELLCQKELHTG